VIKKYVKYVKEGGAKWRWKIRETVGEFEKKLSRGVVALEIIEPTYKKTERFFWCQQCLQCATMLQSSKNSRFLMQNCNARFSAWTPL